MPWISDSPLYCTAKSMMVVVPPCAAAIVPVRKSSDADVPPNGSSMCVCGSMPPGMTSLPEASIVRSASIVELRADDGDLAVFDQDVGFVVVDRGDDAAVLD